MGQKAGDTACEKELRLWGFASEPCQHLAGIAFAFGSDGAAVDDNDLSLRGFATFVSSRTYPRFTDGLTFVLIDLAAKGDDLKCPRLVHR